MSTKYNSELIDNLYKEQNSEKAKEISGEMEDIKDPIFVRSIFSAYMKFRYSSCSHFFLIDLMKFDIPESIELLKRIVLEKNHTRGDLRYLIDFCLGKEYFPDEFTKQVERHFQIEINPNIFYQYLGQYLQYFLQIGKFSSFEKIVKGIFEDETFRYDSRQTALKYLLKYDSEKYFHYYYDNYDEIKGRKSEIILSNEMGEWNNGIIPKFKEKIVNEGSDRAREIIEKKIKEEVGTDDEKEKRAEKKFNNAKIIEEIASLREKINIQTNGDVRFGFPLLLPTELLFQQMEGPDDKQKLTGYCMGLRSIIQGINENVSKHGITDDEIKKKYPEIETKGSINNLYLFLVSRGILVENDLFGLRSLNQIVSKMGHPESGGEELVEHLKSLEFYDFYKNDDWYKIHRGLLVKYKEALSLLHESMK